MSLVAAARTFAPSHPAPAAETARTITSVRGAEHVRLTPAFGDSPAETLVRFCLHGVAEAPVVVVQGGISARRDVCDSPTAAAPGWWNEVVGPGRAIDTARWRVLAIDWITPADLGARAIATSDQADAIVALLDRLGIARAAAFVGASYGAMVGLALAQRHPDRIRHLVAISGAHRSHPLATALRAIQREIVRFGLDTGESARGLALARALAMTTYRGAAEFAQRFDAEPLDDGDRFRFPVEQYLLAAGERFVDRFDPQRYLGLSESIDLHRVDPAAIAVPTTVIAVDSDRVVPLADLDALVAQLPAPAELHRIDSPYGHDAFLKEPAAIGAVLDHALSTLTRPTTP
jgi:homoserine O-acetyltransferase